VSHLTLLEDDFIRRGMTRKKPSHAIHFDGPGADEGLHRDARLSCGWMRRGRDLQYAVDTSAVRPVPAPIV